MIDWTHRTDELLPQGVRRPAHAKALHCVSGCGCRLLDLILPRTEMLVLHEGETFEATTAIAPLLRSHATRGMNVSAILHESIWIANA